MRDIELLQTVLEFVEDQYQDDYILTKSVLLYLHAEHSALLTALPLIACRALASIAHPLIGRNYDDQEFLFANELYLTRCLQVGEGVEAALNAWLSDIVSVRYFWPIQLFRYPKAPLAPTIFRLLYNSLPKLMKEMSECLINCFVTAVKETGVKLIDMEDRGAAVFDRLNHDLSLDWDQIGYILWRSKDIRFYSGAGLWVMYGNHPILTDVFRLRPDLVIRDLSELLDRIAQYPFLQTRFLRSRKLFAFFKLDEKISAWCEDKFSGDSRSKNAVLFMYSFVASLESYQRLAGDRLVQGARIDTSVGNSSLFSAASCHLKNLDSPPGEFFPLVRGCLVGGGDLFYAALHAFHKACYNVPYASAVPEILPLLQAPVSVMKKGVALVAQICPRDEAVEHLRQLWVTAKHYSARTVILVHLLSFFLDDPSAETWEALKRSIAESDDPLLPSLPNISSIPIIFVKDFSETMWKMLTALPPSKNKRSTENKLLRELVNYVELLSDSYCKAVISPTLFTPDSNVNDLTVKYLALGQAPVYEKIIFVKTIFNERVDLDPHAVFQFISAMVKAQRSEVFNFLPEFMLSFKDEFKRVELFEGRWMLLYLNVIQETLKEGKEDLVAIGPAIAKLWLSEPDRALLHPLLTRSLQRVFKTSEIHGVVAGMLLEDEPAVSIAALQALSHDQWTVGAEDDWPEREGGNADHALVPGGSHDQTMHHVILDTFRIYRGSTFKLYFKQYLALDIRI